MQLTRKVPIRGALAAATAALLGGAAAHAAPGDKVESSLLLYSESQRVQAAEGILNLSRVLQGNRLFNIQFTFDGLTGATPSGAAPSSQVQTITRPSGRRPYETKAGQIPLDHSFKDTRLAVDGSLTQPITRLTSLIGGAHLSGERDYASVGVHGGFTQDLNRRNTTLSASVAYSYDYVNPRGGTPTPLSVQPNASASGTGFNGTVVGNGSGASKNVFDIVAGITQVLDRRSVLRLNYSRGNLTGYLNDPYKILSVVGNPTDSAPGEPLEYLYESRPGSRTSQSVYGELRRYILGQTIDLSYRYFWDTWGITSKTADVRYRIPVAHGYALEPHFRWYRQTSSDFYRSYLVDGDPLPANASADSRLAPFHAMTFGLQFLFPAGMEDQMSVGVEYYHQSGDLSPPPASLGALSHYGLFPTLNAVMIRVGLNRAL